MESLKPYCPRELREIRPNIKGFVSFIFLLFKSSVPAKNWWVGSIPMHFRHTVKTGSYKPWD